MAATTAIKMTEGNDKKEWQNISIQIHSVFPTSPHLFQKGRVKFEKMYIRKMGGLKKWRLRGE